MKATNPDGTLRTLNDKCYIAVPAPTTVSGSGLEIINLKILPELGSSTSAKFNSEHVIGRGAPIKTYANTDDRILNMKLTFLATTRNELIQNYQNLRILRSAVYPSDGIQGPYIPPPVCQISCGKILSESTVCAVLENINENFPTDVVWDDELMVPYLFYVDVSFHLVYSSNNLPNQNKIISYGA